MTAKLLVSLAGVALVVFINWYFFLSGRKRRRGKGRPRE